MPLTNLEEDWLIHSRTRRKTKTVRIDTRLLEETKKLGIRRGQFSDILNLALKRYLEAIMDESKQSQIARQEVTEPASN